MEYTRVNNVLDFWKENKDPGAMLLFFFTNVKIEFSLYFNFKNNIFYFAKHVSKYTYFYFIAKSIIKTVNILNLRIS